MHTPTLFRSGRRPGRRRLSTCSTAVLAGLLLLGSFAAQAQLAAPGTYTINPAGAAPGAGPSYASGTNFQTFTQAVTALNATPSPMAGAVTFNVANSAAFSEAGGVPAITASGTSGNPIVFRKVTFSPVNLTTNPTVTRASGSTGATDTVIPISGGDWITFDGINATAGDATVEYGYLVRNGSATNGATNNTIRNARITMVRLAATNSTVGVLQSSSASTTAGSHGGGGFAPTAASGINEGNLYENLTVSNGYRGISLLCGNIAAVFYDQNNVVRNCTVDGGPATPATTATTPSTGILVQNQNNAVVNNNTVRNIVSAGSGTAGNALGIYINEVFGTDNYVYNNQITGIRIASATAATTAVAYGLVLDTDNSTVGPPPSHRLIAFNNFVSDLTNNSTSSTATTRRIIGIATQLAGTGANNTINVSHNAVRIGTAAGTTSSSTAFASLNTTGPVLTLRNNIFANLSGDQTGAYRHYAIVSSSGTLFGNTGSTSDFNDLVVSGVNGAIGLGSATEFVTFANWQAAYPGYGAGGTVPIDNSSKSVDPGFTSATDLHVSSGFLNNVGTPVAFTPAALGFDIDNAARSATTPDIGADEFSPAAANDVAVNSITAPAVPAASGPQTVTVSISNIGNANLTSVTLAYKLNGSMTAVTQTFTTANAGLNLAPGGTTTLSFTTQANLLTGSNTLEVTATAPNTAADPTPANNIVTTTVVTTLSGPYTIDSGAGASATNFVSFTAAADALAQRGVSGPVTFAVSVGTYLERLVLGVIAGTSSTNTVIFNGGGSTLRFGGASGQPVVVLNGADFVTVNNLVIDATNNNTSPVFGWGVLLTNAADNNTISNCTITTVANSTGLGYAGIVASGSFTSPTTAGNNANSLTLSGNTITNGYYGITLMGVVATPATGNAATNNIVKDPYLYGIYINGQDGAQLTGNDISRPLRTTVTTFGGIFFTGISSNCRVERNKIHEPFTGIPASTSAAYGIYFTGVDATAGNGNVVANNLIYDFNGAGIEYGIYTVSSDYSFFYHNTVSLDNTASTATAVSYGIYQLTAADGVDIRNNVVSVTRGGTGNRIALAFGTTTSNITSNYNDLYVGSGSNFFTGLYGGATFANLTDWKTAGGPGAPVAGLYDQNSVEANPGFTAGILVPTSATLDAVGDNTVGGPATPVTLDFASVARTSPPDLGAYQFTPPSADVSLTAFVAPVPPIAAGSTPVTVTVLNNGSTTLTGLTLKYTLNGNTAAAVTQVFSSLNIAGGASGPVSFSAVNNATLLPGSNTLTVVATLPNGATDPSPAFNTITTTFSIALAAGTYTINSAAATNVSTGGSNFQSFTDVAAALNNGGILGSVVFNVVTGSGPYTEQFMLGDVAGTSSTSTITVNGNGRTLTSGATTASVGGLGVINLNGTDYVTVNNLVVNATATTVTAGIRLTNAADNNTINGCTVTVDPTALATTTAGIAASGGTTVSAVGNAANNLTLNNNIVTGAYYCIIVNGASAASRSTGLTLSGNTVRDFYAYGIDVESQDNPQIIGNDVSRPTRGSVTSFFGIYLTNCLSADVERNRIHDSFTGIPTSTSVAYGIQFTTNDAVSGSENDVVNNLIYNFNGAGIEYGIYNVGSDFARYYHNTISLDNTASTATAVSYGFYQTTAASGVEFRNNVVSVTRGGTGNRIALVYATAASLITSDYNDLYVGLTPGTAPYFTGAFGSTTTTFGTLSQWAGANTNAYDQNSVQVAPDFAAPATGNLQPAAAALNGTGAPALLTRVPKDFNNTANRNNPPDPGAYEFSPAATDVAPVALTAPAIGQSCYSTAQAVTVSVRNRGTNPITFTSGASAAVTVVVSGAVSETLTGSITSGTLNPGTSQPVTLTAGGPNGNGTLNMGTAGTYTFAVTATVSGDGNAANDLLVPNPSITVVAPVAGTLSPSAANVCQGQTQAFTLAGASNGAIQYQVSTTPGGMSGFANVATGGMTASYTTPALVPGTYYFRALTVCNANQPPSNVATIVVDNPQPVSVTAAPGSVCEGNVTTIDVVKTAGQTGARLYTTATGGTSLVPTVSSNTSTFTTPTLTAGPNTFYASALTGSQENVGRVAPTANTTASASNWGLVFNATAPFVLTSVDVYPTAAGNVVVQVQDNTGALIPGLTATVPVTAGSGTVAQTIPLNFAVPTGTGLRLIAVSSPLMVRESTGATFPLTSSPSGTVSITSGYISGTSAVYYFFYNWQIGSQCEGVRVPVTVTPSAAPAFTFLPGTTQTVCAGTSVNASGTYSTANYDTFVYTSSTSAAVAGIGAGSNNSPARTLTPTATTTYTITASKAGAGAGGCQAVRTLTVNVNPLPGVTLTGPASAVCVGNPATLTAVNDQDIDPTVFRITEVFTNRGATGAGVYPTYLVASAETAVEVSNLSNIPMDAGGLILDFYYLAGANATVAFTSSITIPVNTIVPVGGVLVVGKSSALGAGTPNSSADRFFFATNTTAVDYQSSGSSGFVLRNGANIIDVAALNGAQFPPSANVTAADFNGVTASSNALAGVVRTAATDTNTGANFAPSSTTNVQTFGVYNTAQNYTTISGTVTNPNFSYQYSASPNTGTFANASAQSTTFTPNTDGPYTISLLTTNLTTGCPITKPVTINTLARTLAGTQTLSGTYCDLTISGGTTTLTGDVTITGNLIVRDGATLLTDGFLVLGAGNFDLQAGGTLGIKATDGIRATAIGGAIRTTGTRSFSNNANYLYNGTDLQSTGDGLPARVRNLVVSNAANVQLTNPTSVAEVALLNSGLLVTNGNAFTLLSRIGQGTALLVDRNTNTTAVNGRATMQRAVDILTSDNIGYHHYSSPVVSTPIEDLQTPGFDFVLNAAYNTAASAGTVRPFPTVFGYDDTRTTSTTVGVDQNAFNKGFFSPAAGSAMPVGRGFTASVPNALLIDFNGTFNNGDIALGGLTRTSATDATTGYNLVGNPYPAPIDWTKVDNTQFTGGVQTAVYQYHATSRYDGFYTTIQPSGIVVIPSTVTNRPDLVGNTLLPAGSGFFAYMPLGTTSGSINLTNQDRATAFAGQPLYGRASSTRPLVRLQVRGAGLQDELFVLADAAATAGYDAAFDAAKLSNTNGLNLAALAAGRSLAIDALPSFAAATVVPLTLGAPAAGTYTFEVAQLANLGTTRAYLRDAVAGTETLLTAGTQVPVTLTNIATATTRFSLVFRPSGALATTASLTAGQVSLYPNPAHSQFTVLLPPVAGAKDVKATLLNALGQVVTTRTIALTAAGATAEFNTSALAQGVYMLHLTAGNETLTQKVVVE